MSKILRPASPESQKRIKEAFSELEKYSNYSNNSDSLPLRLVFLSILPYIYFDWNDYSFKVEDLIATKKEIKEAEIKDVIKFVNICAGLILDEEKSLDKVTLSSFRRTVESPKFDEEDYEEILKNIKEKMSQVEIFGEKRRDDENKYFTLSPLRQIDFEYSSHSFDSKIYDFTKSLLIDSLVLKNLSDFNVSQDRYEILPFRPSKQEALFEDEGEFHPSDLRSSSFLRDYFVPIAGKTYVSCDEILQECEREIDLGWVVGKKSYLADSSELNDVCNEAPLLINGGNVIVCEDKNLLILAIPEFFYDEEGRFKGGYFLENEEVLEIEDERDFEKKYRNWAKSLGFDAVILKRNLKDYSLSEIYHLDVFLGVFDDILVISDDENGEIPFDRESYDKLVEIFGEENCYKMSQKDRKNCLTNSILVDGVLTLSSPLISQKAIDFFVEKGFGVVRPPFHLGMSTEDGIRCHTQKQPQNQLKANFFEPIE